MKKLMTSPALMITVMLVIAVLVAVLVNLFVIKHKEVETTDKDGVKSNEIKSYLFSTPKAV